MKKICTSLVVCFLLSYPAFSQVKFGAKAGINLADVWMSDLPDNADPTIHQVSKTEMRLSYHVGGFSDISINSRLSALLELLYSNKGFMTEDMNGEVDNLHFHYINLPLILNYVVTENLHLGIGPELGYLFSVGVKDNHDYREIHYVYENKFDIGIDANVEYKPVKFLNIGLRYNYGLSNIFNNKVGFFVDKQGNIIETIPKMQNRVLQVYLGYVFNWDKN